MIRLIVNDASGIYNVGTELKSMYDLAKRTRVSDVAPTVNLPDTAPKNVTMNLDKLNRELNTSKKKYKVG